MNYLVDTNILIDHLRGVADARSFIRHARKHGELWVSAITVAELYVGQMMKQPSEVAKTKRLLWLFRVAHLDGSTAAKGGAVARDHGIDLPDALIAATALNKNLPVATRNVKHFSPVPKLTVHQPY